MNKPKIKLLEVDEKSHAIAKAKAKELGMTLKGYIRNLIQRDNKA